MSECKHEWGGLVTRDVQLHCSYCNKNISFVQYEMTLKERIKELEGLLENFDYELDEFLVNSPLYDDGEGFSCVYCEAAFGGGVGHKADCPWIRLKTFYKALQKGKGVSDAKNK